MKRLMIKLGMHGKAHRAAIARIFESMHDNGLGA
jgi:hypothetical protein